MVRKIGLALFLFSLVFSVKADYWELPTCKIYYSADSSSCIYVVPACITVVKKRKNKQFDTCSGSCVEKRPCLATVTVHGEGYRSRTSSYSFELANLYAPQQAFISNDGVYVVSINEWGSAGTGKNVLVVYKNGNLVKRYSLPEISPISIWDYYRTTSSFWWFDGLKFINNNSFKIFFRDKNGKNLSVFWIWKETNKHNQNHY